MLWHFTIRPTEDFADVRTRVLAHVERDPRIVLWRRGALETLIFCPGEQTAELQRRWIAQGQPPSPSLASVDLLEARGRLRFNLECGPESRAMVAPFAAWVLATFPASRVVEEETQTDVTDRARSDPAYLFE
jgi:hypothetical protein